VQRKGISLVTDGGRATASIAAWAAAGLGTLRPDCLLHGEAPARLADVIQQLMGRIHGKA
jgi:hypothetical protein